MSEEFNFSRRFLNKESEDCAKRHSVLSTTSSTSIPVAPFYHRDSLTKYNLRPRTKTNQQVVKSQKTATKTTTTSKQASTSGSGSSTRYNLSSSSTSNNDSVASTISLQNKSQEFLIFSSEEEDSEVEGAGNGSENLEESHSQSQSQYQSQGSSTGFNDQENSTSSETSDEFHDFAYLQDQDQDQECDREDEMVPIFLAPHPNYKVKNGRTSIKNKVHTPIIIHRSLSSSSPLPGDTSFDLNTLKMKYDNTEAIRLARFAEIKNELLRKERTIWGSFVPIFAFTLFFLSIFISFVFFFGDKKDNSLDNCFCSSQKNPFFKLSYNDNPSV